MRGTLWHCDTVTFSQTTDLAFRRINIIYVKLIEGNFNQPTSKLETLKSPDNVSQNHYPQFNRIFMRNSRGVRFWKQFVLNPLGDALTLGAIIDRFWMSFTLINGKTVECGELKIKISFQIFVLSVKICQIPADTELAVQARTQVWVRTINITWLPHYQGGLLPTPLHWLLYCYSEASLVWAYSQYCNLEMFWKQIWELFN